jgi:hypothetical protein
LNIQQTEDQIRFHLARFLMCSSVRMTLNRAGAEKAAQHHKATGTEKSNNHSQHNAEQATPAKATRTDTKLQPAPAAQDSETSKTKKGHRAQAGLAGVGVSPARKPAKPRQTVM